MGLIYRVTARQITLNNKVTPVVFGHYAWRKDWEKEKVAVAGSGIFIGPSLGLGAKHVSKGFEYLDERIEAAKRRTSMFTSQYAIKPIVTDYAGLVYQAPTVRFPTDEDVFIWGATVDWPSPDTDITILQTEPIWPAATKNGRRVFPGVATSPASSRR